MKKLFIFLVVSITGVAVYSQSVAINTDGSLPHPSAMLDVKNANKGVLLPRTSTTTRNTIPAVKGLMVYDTTTNSFWFLIHKFCISSTNSSEACMVLFVLRN